MTLEEKIKLEAELLGFDLVRIAKAEHLNDEEQFFKNWLQKGHGGSMNYLEKEPEKRSNPEKILPGAKSVICLGMNYFQNADAKISQETTSKKSQPQIKIARYARGRDYHKVIGKKLKKLSATLELLLESKNYVDTGPVLERSFSEKAGIGFIGKNSCIITREFGSWIFLAEIFTTKELKTDPPSRWKAGCGSCHRCIDICPTKAILPDRTIDATKCISYLTIENRGEIPLELREKIGTWLFGCDLCQEICPHNIRAQPTKVEDFKNIRIGTQVHDLQKILEIKNDEEFKKLFAGTPFMRAKRRGLMRNACVVAGNLKEKSLLPILEKLLHDEDSLIAEHAKWALSSITASISSPQTPSSHFQNAPSQTINH